MKVRIARFSVSIWRNIYAEFDFSVQKTDTFVINGMAGSVDSTGHIATNCRNVCSVSLMSAHGTHSAYSRTPAGATVCRSAQFGQRKKKKKFLYINMTTNNSDYSYN